MTTATATISRRDPLAMAACPERTLMADVARGDTHAFEELYRRHSRNVHMQARKLCASRELAEEVAQDAFLSLWRSAGAYRPAATGVGPWLSSIVRNRAIDAWRRAAARPVGVEAHEEGAGQLRAPAAIEPAAEDRALVLSLIGELPIAQRQAVFLAYFGDLTHAEIATLADTPLGTIKGRIRLGVEKLGRALEPQVA
jgi:RNA polymerase sigma-70 factor (ECF subfamily)